MILFQYSKLNGILVSPYLIGLKIYHSNLLIQKMIPLFQDFISDQEILYHYF